MMIYAHERMKHGAHKRGGNILRVGGGARHMYIIQSERLLPSLMATNTRPDDMHLY